MTRRKTKSLTRQEDFINEQIIIAVEHTPNFDSNLISNGKYTFGELIVFLKLANRYEDFKEWIESMQNVEVKGLTFDKIYKDEVSADDLPFAELEKEYE